ncbi:hypothetical protein [Nitrincola alkalisediminis]|uniref:hypothetical protein n=1 Tax=Nitrincola alkalisediminis TaxID=1366656 RepID=UPI0018736B4F|nr:hypothetical protein [Nitrincola alkalisediminis]
MKIDQTQVNNIRIGHPDASSRVSALNGSSGFGDLLEQMMQQSSQPSPHAQTTASQALDESTRVEDEATSQKQREAVRDQLLALLGMTPAERIRFAYLQSKGLTEEQLAALPPEEREKIEAEIQEELKHKLAAVADRQEARI